MEMTSSQVVGVPTEIKSDEGRVSLTPDGVRELRGHDVEVVVEAGAGGAASITDEEYTDAGATIVTTAAEVWERATIVCKVKEPQGPELDQLRPGLVLFTYLHLAGYPKVADALLESGTTAVAYETVESAKGGLPLLAPMSEIAGRMSVQIGARFLERPSGGRGVLLGGAPGVKPGTVVVIGAGNVGWNAAWMASGLEAHVSLLDRDVDRLRFLDQIARGRVTTLTSNRGQVERAVEEADLVIGAVLVAGGRAPVVVDEDLVRAMKPGAVIVDIAIDQGGCIATSHETTHKAPVFERHGVLHYAVGNMPGAVPNTSTYALTNVTLPYLVSMARHGLPEAARRDPGLAMGINVMDGSVTNAAVAEALDLDHCPVDDVLDAAGTT